MRKTTTISLFLSGVTAADVSLAASQKPMNVLFVIVDDLRIELNSYGFPHMKTPNLDRLAAMGMQFNRAYVQQAVCAASRASFLTGCRPESTGVSYPYTPWFNEVFREEYPTLAEFFTERGYYTRTLGKVHHGPPDQNVSEPHYDSLAPPYLLPENQFEGRVTEWRHRVKPWEHADLPDSEYEDGQIADETVATIRRALKQGQPFFIMPGFKKPHLPFVCPARYHDLYSDTEIQLAPHPERSDLQPDFTVRARAEASLYWNYLEKGIDDENARQLIRSYYACVSFIDAQIGKILDELEARDLLDSTVILVCSDHGFHLGDHGTWGKSTNFEWATRSPLFLYVPGVQTTGAKTDALVEYVDLYPTILDACGFDLPDYLEGVSLMSLLDNPDRPWKGGAFSRQPRFIRGEGESMGYSIRTDQFRYTQWRTDRGEGPVVFEELYDHREHMLESENIARNPEFRGVLEKHREKMASGWKELLPPGVTTRSDLPPGDTSFYLLSPEERQARLSEQQQMSETSETKPWLARLLERHPEADANGDGILTYEEARAWQERNRGD